MTLSYSYRDCSPEARVWFDQVADTAVMWNLSTATMATGINTITEDNAEKFWKRYCAIQYAQGSPAYISEKLVHFSVGFSTNATTLTDTQFKHLLAQHLFDRARGMVEEPNTEEIDSRLPDGSKE